MSGAVIATEALTKRYGSQRGVEELTFEVQPGEVFGYLGPNGAGKTTTIRTLLDFIRPTAGRATVLGLDSHGDCLEIRRRAGYLPGEFALYENLTGEEFLRHLGALRGGVEWGNVAAFAERFRCDLTRRIRTLSHGTKQKIGLIQAFMHQPELLVMDEPTQGLDPLMQQEFQALLAEARGEGATVFLSSHVLPEVERICDRIGIIREGRLIAVEDVGELKSRALRSVEIHFAHQAPGDAFADLPGVGEVSVQGDDMRCTVAGSMDALVKTAARFEVVNLASHEPSLEDIFLALYGGDGGDPGVG